MIFPQTLKDFVGRVGSLAGTVGVETMRMLDTAEDSTVLRIFQTTIERTLAASGLSDARQKRLAKLLRDAATNISG